MILMRPVGSWLVMLLTAQPHDEPVSVRWLNPIGLPTFDKPIADLLCAVSGDAQGWPIGQCLIGPVFEVRRAGLHVKGHNLNTG